MVPELCFVTASRANAFMAEILEAIGSVASAHGIATSFAVDEFPQLGPDGVYVTIPHELYPFLPPERLPEEDVLRRTVSLCVEHVGTVWFEISHDWARRTGAVLDINRSAAAELRRRGVPAEHVQLGYCAAWDAWRGDATRERPLDVVYAGSTDPRRDALLAGYAPALHEHRCSINVPPIEPKTGPRPGYYLRDERHRLLASAKLLLNVHRGESRAHEWVRVLEAIANGCVVVSEHSVDAAPLVPGEHFVSGAPGHLGELAAHLLDRPELLDRIRTDAYAYVCGELRMDAAVERLAGVAERVARSAAPQHPRPALGPLPPEAPVEEALDLSQVDYTRVALKRLIDETAQVRRAVDDLRSRLAGETEELVEVLRTPAYEPASPRVTVGVSVYDYEREVVDALASVAASRYADYDVVVVDDASSDGSVEAVRGFLEARPWLPAALYRRRVNGGPALARNAIAGLARGELLLVLDADNGVYPTCIERLVEALDADPAAAAAFPILEVRSAGRPSLLWNRSAWDPEHLREESYIDAFALVRRSAFAAIGGYRDDPRLDLEDYDFWCRLADAGHHAVHVPEILAWYRLGLHSRLAAALVDRSASLSLVREGSPSLFARH